MSTAVQDEIHLGAADPITGPVSIAVKLEQDAQDRFYLTLPLESEYLSIAEGFDDVLTWDLEVPAHLNAYFDNPAITFSGQNSGALLINRQPNQVQYRWANLDDLSRGQSFYYTIHVVVNRDGMLIPVNHDPTVHNDPPT